MAGAMPDGVRPSPRPHRSRFLVPHVAVPAETAWFWKDGHQAAEREADSDLTAGRHTDFDTAEQLLAHLENLDRQAEDHT